MANPDRRRPASEQIVTDAEEGAEMESAIARSLRKWKLATVYLGLALFVSVASVVPFLYGHSLHNHWDAVGKNIVLLAMVLLSAFCYAAGTTYNFWSYLRAVQKIDRENPPGADEAGE